VSKLDAFNWPTIDNWPSYGFDPRLFERRVTIERCREFDDIARPRLEIASEIRSLATAYNGMFSRFESRGYIVTWRGDPADVLVVLPSGINRYEARDVVEDLAMVGHIYGVSLRTVVRLGAIVRSPAAVTARGGVLTLPQAVAIEAGHDVAVCDVETGDVLLVAGKLLKIECTVTQEAP
jgi:hypothetical protein